MMKRFFLTVLGSSAVLAFSLSVAVPFATFAEESSTKSLHVVSPNGGEKWAAGQTYVIRWQATGIDRVAVYVNRPNTATTLLGSFPASSGSFTWSIPDSFTAANDYTVSIWDAYGRSGIGSVNSANDSSDAPFTIFVPGSGTNTTTTTKNSVDARQVRIQKLQEQKTQRMQELQQKQQEFQNTLQEKRDALQQHREQEKENLQTKVKELRDERKQTIALRVAENLNKVNDKRVDLEVKHLDRLDAILDKIEKRTDDAEANGKNVTAVRTAVSAARAAIVSARTAVLAQAQKVYSIDTTDMEHFGQAVRATVQQLHTDHKALRTGVMATAKEKVRAAFEALKNAVRTGENAAETGGE